MLYGVDHTIITSFHHYELLLFVMVWDSQIFHDEFEDSMCLWHVAIS